MEEASIGPRGILARVGATPQKEGQAFNIADRAADFALKPKSTFNLPIRQNEVFNFIGDVRNGLTVRAEIIAGGVPAIYLNRCGLW